jgi:hypothetical protein
VRAGTRDIRDSPDEISRGGATVPSMKGAIRLLLVLSLVLVASAGTVRVTVGNTGCRTKQLTVQRLWKAMPGVKSVAILPRKSGDPANQRVFIVATTGAIPDQAALSRALGRRAGRYPILAHAAGTIR